MVKLPVSFYLRDDVLGIAKELLGKVLITNWQGVYTSGRIVETEAYAGELDKASHASKGKTSRTGVIFGTGGVAYVYLCYGIHEMFNIVTNEEGKAHAVLVRAVEPMEGVAAMMIRTGKKVLDETIARGPGNVGKAFGFHRSQTGMSLLSDELYLADDGFLVEEKHVIATPRIGVDYAGSDALLDYRFYIKGNKHVSGKRIK
jgi:DNA-3-methyladenine glycosylase